MSRDKSTWYLEEILLDAALINHKLELGEWAAVEDMLRAEAQLSRDQETGRPRPKKASEYTLRLIAEVLHFMRIELERAPYNISTLAVAEQCLRLIRSCAAYGMKIQTYICKDLNILDDMLAIFTDYQHPNEDITNEEVTKKLDSCMVALTQTLGNLVVNNAFNQTIIWEKLGANILNALMGPNEKIASCAAMIVYNILLGQPNVLPDDVLLLNALGYMYSDGNSEFPHLIIEYLIGVENSYIEKLYNRLEPDTRLLILNLAYNILTCIETQDFNVSVNFIKFISHEFKMKSDCILKTVDKYVNSIEPQEVVYLLDIIATASSMDAYMECLQSDISLFINCAFLLRSIHKLGKQEDNFFSSIHKLYNAAGKTMPANVADNLNSERKDSIQTNPEKIDLNEAQDTVKKCDSTDMLQCNETVSECTESESSEQYFECTDQVSYPDKSEPQTVIENIIIPQSIPESQPLDTSMNNVNQISEKPQSTPIPKPIIIDRKASDYCKIDENLIKVAFAKNIRSEQNNFEHSAISTLPNVLQNNSSRKSSVDNKLDVSDDMEPPLITDSPDEAIIVDQKNDTLNISRKVSLDMNLGRKDSLGIQNYVNTSISNPIVRQLSVERAVEASEVVIREMTGSLQNAATVQIAPVENAAQSSDHVKTSEPIPVKKNQNVTSEFDLSEQLQKILGISSDKTIRSDSSDLTKEAHSVQSTHTPKVVDPLPVATQSPLPASLPNVDNVLQKNKGQVKIPNVKIDSPENNLKTKLGNFDHTGPKQLSSVVESVEQHVAFGFKATVIRTLGNLCWKNQINKRQIRELEVIPVLLDCCNIDARNPLIMQWVIFAVRNLCENCPENQSVIASLTLQEPVNDQLLQEMGMTLHADSQNNSIKLVPLLKK